MKTQCGPEAGSSRIGSAPGAEFEAQRLAHRPERPRRSRQPAGAPLPSIPSQGGRQRLEVSLTPRRLGAEANLSRLAILFTVVAFAGFLVDTASGASFRAMNLGQLAGTLLYVGIVSFLVYGGLVYLFCRIGHLQRRRAFSPHTDADVAAFRDSTSARVTVLVPSYREEARVVRQALLSAALQTYPNRRVVLLIDDPPNPHGAEEQALLAAARRLPHEVEELLSGPREQFTRACVRAHARSAGGEFDARCEAHDLAWLYDRLAGWFEEQASRLERRDHMDELFAEQTLHAPARKHRETAAQLRHIAACRDACPDEADLLCHYRWLDSAFRVEVTSFERKGYRNLSHAPNKAMNLNSYISLLGRRVAEAQGRGGIVLRAASAAEPGVDIPESEYVLTLDADSVLSPDYTATLVEVMEDAGNERIAVVQTPYSSVPGAPGNVERVAGATTDIQYMIHQGFTHHGATFWVGANAVLRKAALDDIATDADDIGGGLTLRKFIQDRTVIEDTESSVDLVVRGWRLHNYPERLSYSATPPDYGALLIQRRRWANGGLLILPKLLLLLQRDRGTRPSMGELLMRLHYLTSIAGVNAGLLLLLTLPFADWLSNPWLPLTALPYFTLYTRDLRLVGYRRLDVFRVYALNLMLVPVNLGGVFKSLHQALTGKATPFRRTPKVNDRTAVPRLYVLAPCIGVVCLCAGFAFDASSGLWLNALAAGVNAAFLGYAIRTFIGWRHLREDLFGRPALEGEASEGEPGSRKERIDRRARERQRSTPARTAPLGTQPLASGPQPRSGAPPSHLAPGRHAAPVLRPAAERRSQATAKEQLVQREGRLRQAAQHARSNGEQRLRVDAERLQRGSEERIPLESERIRHDVHQRTRVAIKNARHGTHVPVRQAGQQASREAEERARLESERIRHLVKERTRVAIEDARRQTDVRLRQAARRASQEAEEHLQAEERLEWSSEVTERLVRNPS